MLRKIFKFLFLISLVPTIGITLYISFFSSDDITVEKFGWFAVMAAFTQVILFGFLWLLSETLTAPKNKYHADKSVNLSQVDAAEFSQILRSIKITQILLTISIASIFFPVHVYVLELLDAYFETSSIERVINGLLLVVMITLLVHLVALSRKKRKFSLQ